MPFSLARHFQCSREYTVAENRYKNGESQRALRTATSRKSWSRGAILTAAQLATLRTFYNARRHEPFYFYDGLETSPRFSYDDTGVATTGRFTVRFEGKWQEDLSMVRSNVTLALVELA